jgi:hypothetical protein
MADNNSTPPVKKRDKSMNANTLLVLNQILKDGLQMLGDTAESKVAFEGYDIHPLTILICFTKLFSCSKQRECLARMLLTTVLLNTLQKCGD